VQWQAGKHRGAHDSGFAAAVAPSMSRWSLVGTSRELGVGGGGYWSSIGELKITTRKK